MEVVSDTIWEWWDKIALLAWMNIFTLSDRLYTHILRLGVFSYRDTCKCICNKSSNPEASVALCFFLILVSLVFIFFYLLEMPSEHNTSIEIFSVLQHIYDNIIIFSFWTTGLGCHYLWACLFRMFWIKAIQFKWQVNLGEKKKIKNLILNIITVIMLGWSSSHYK